MEKLDAERLDATKLQPHSLTWSQVAPAIAFSEALAVAIISILAGTIYSTIAYGTPGNVSSHAALGLVVGLLFIAISKARGAYEFAAYTGSAASAGKTFMVWNLAFLALFTVLFVLKAGPDFSRGTAALLYLLGLAALSSMRGFASRAVVAASKTGQIAARRIFLFGRRRDVIAFGTRYQPWNDGLAVVGVEMLQDEDNSSDAADTRPATDPADGTAASAADERAAQRQAVAIANAIEQARRTAPDDIFLVIPWTETGFLDAAAEAFKAVPASIHLGPSGILERYENVHLARTGSVLSLELTRAPLTIGEQLAKRALDVALASTALVLLSPLLGLIALAIRFDSPGPALFRQRRHGFNQNEFKIYKFRTMAVMEDGDNFQQAQADDIRLTRLGRLFRRINFDELPQLINVLRGEMSIVGPRPQALSQNADFERRISLYARRHNVKPGITGWAQVHGFRGPTDTDEKMRQRIEHDLYYLDNWSLLLDLKIIAMTVLSPKAYDNAH